MLNIGPQELIVVLLIALIVVGPKRLPELGRSIGRALTEFRKVQSDVRDTLRFGAEDEPTFVSPTKARNAPPAQAGDPVPNPSALGDGTDAEEGSADGSSRPSPDDPSSD
jgi:sec-independent protein translocase protein TatA